MYASRFSFVIFPVCLLASILWFDSFHALPSLGQETDEDAAFQTKADRFEKVVLRRPRRGTALELWVRHYRDANRLDELKQRLTSRLDTEQDDASLWLAWGLVCQELGNRETALAAFKQASTLIPGDYYVHLLLGDELMRQRKTVEATKALETALEMRVPRLDYLAMSKQLASAYRQLGEFDKSEAIAEQLAKQFANDTRVLTELAGDLQRQGNRESALQIWKSIESQSQDDPFQRFTAGMEIARLYLQASEQALAVEQLEPLLDQVRPESWQAENVIALLESALQNQGGTQQLIDFWTARLERQPNDLTSMTRLAAAFSSADQIDQAETIYQQALQRSPQNQAIHQGLISMYIREGNFDAAIRQQTELTKLNPTDAETKLELGRLHLQGSSRDPARARQLAVKAWEPIAAIDSSDAALAMQVANACLEAAIPTDLVGGSKVKVLPAVLLDQEAVLLTTAERFLREAIQRDPTSPQYQEYLAQLLHQLNRRDEAIQTCLAMAADKSAAAWDEVSRTLERLGYLDEAVSAAASAAKQTTSDLAYQERWVNLLVTVGRYEEALEQLKIWPTSSIAWMEAAVRFRVMIATRSDTIRETTAELDETAQDNPNDVAAVWTQASLLAASGQPVEAARKMSLAVERSPESPVLVRQLAKMLESANQPSLAVEQYQRLIQLDRARHQDDYQRIIDLELRQNNLQAAMQAANALIRAAPNNPESHLLRATVSMRGGDFDQRLESIERAVQVAPNDLQMRRQYATALRDSRQNQRALEEAFSCFQLSESLVEKRTILSWILDWTSDLDQRKWLLEQVNRARRGKDDIYSGTLSLVHLLDRMNRTDKAIEELSALQRQFPNDTTILDDLVRLAETTNQPSIAVKYQEQLTRLQRDAQGLEKLARLYRQNNQLEAASQIWDELLRDSATYDQIFNAVDRLLERGDVFQAQRFVEAGLARFPESWQLAYRSGLIHLAMDQRSAGRKSLRAVIQTNVGSQLVRGSGLPPEYPRVQTAIQAYTAFRTLAGRIEQQGRRNSRTLQEFFDPKILKAGGSASLQDTKVYAAVSLLVLAYDPEEQVAWIADLANEDRRNPVEVQLAATASWVTGRSADCRQAMEWLDDQSDESTIAKLIVLLNPPYADQGEVDIDPLEKAYRWLRHRRPRIADDVQLLYVTRLCLHSNQEHAARIVIGEIRDSQTFNQLTHFTPLVRILAQPEVTAEFLQAIDRTLIAESGQIDADRVWSALMLSIQIADWKDNEQASVGLQLMETLISQSRLSRITNRTNVSQLSQDPYGKILWSLTKEITTAVRRRPGQGGSVTDATRRWAAAQQRILTAHNSGEYRREGLLFATAPPVSNSAGNANWYPTPTAAINATTLNALNQITSVAKTNGRYDELLSRLNNPERLSSKEDGPSFQLAAAHANWFAEDYEGTIEKLEKWSDEAKGGPATELLVRVYLERRQLPQALEALNQIPSESPVWATLRRAIAKDWSQQALNRDLIGHEGAITDLTFSGDGKQLISASVDRTIKVWNIDTGEVEQSLPDHNDIVLAVEYSPSSDLLASAGYDREVRLWNPETLEPVESLVGHTSAIRGLAFSPDGRLLASAGDDRSIILWDLESRTQRHILEGHRGPVTAISFSPSGETLVSASHDQSLILWDTKTGTEQERLESAHGIVRTVIFTGEDQIVSGHQANTSITWNRGPTNWTQQILPTESAVRSIAVDPARQRVAIGTDDNSVIIQDLKAAKEESILQGHSSRVLSVTFSPDGKQFASAGYDGIIKISRVDIP